MAPGGVDGKPGYPATLRLAGCGCLVVGAGSVGLRKARGLVAAGARVTVVAPEACDGVRELARAGALRWEARAFEAGDAEGMALVFAATPDREVNRAVAEEGARRGAWVNVADDPEGSSLHVPAVLRRGPVTVAVGTEGTAPALAGWVRDRIAAVLPEGLEEMAELARRFRPTGAGAAERARRFFDSGALADLTRGDREAAEAKARAALGEGMELDGREGR